MGVSKGVSPIYGTQVKISTENFKWPSGGKVFFKPFSLFIFLNLIHLLKRVKAFNF